MFFKHFASKNQLPGFYTSETLVENTLRFACEVKLILLKDVNIMRTIEGNLFKVKRHRFSKIDAKKTMFEFI